MKIIWTNGCFDILHRGHMEMFKHAKLLGHKLIVGIDSDNKVKKDKGEDRPINNQYDRKYFLESIKWIDEVIIFNTKHYGCWLRLGRTKYSRESICRRY